MVVETRSQRQQPSYLQRPPYPSIPAPSAHAQQQSSVFQSSSSSLSSLSSLSSAPHSQASPNMLSQPAFGAQAPLPSPNGCQPNSYFDAMAQSSHSAQNRIPVSQGPTVGASNFGQRGAGVGTPETVPFLKDFSLVAEAAKRAQMACLERDLGEVGL
ncbi:hypothetical protein B0A50_08238 [Salinomyces thailandicus]|uniref:Uncharacterized protein n=1 Tax=Salinomyces thailandicus TaxID=706561 RepID=A0A4U0TKN7_9PEZI|nr:hypothetical protein B0A50_08238 [Salinomyces thailandica]